ncbi:MAG: DUF6476 family protein [Pseudomonadota bacterium]
MATITFIIGPNPAPRLDKALSRDVPEDAALSRSRLAKLIADGGVRVDGVVTSDDQILIYDRATSDLRQTIKITPQ